MKTNLNNGAEVKNEVLTYNEILTINKAYKEQSLFRVIDHLNKQKNVVAANGGKITIDGLKSLCPEYFKQAKKDKEGNLIIIDRLLFSPMVFLRAIRKAANGK
jgi:hypothetical protein